MKIKKFNEKLQGEPEVGDYVIITSDTFFTNRPKNLVDYIATTIDLKNNEFSDWESAFEWFNHFNKDTEPTIDIIDNKNCKYAKDIELGEWKSIKAGKNYNL